MQTTFWPQVAMPPVQQANRHLGRVKVAKEMLTEGPIKELIDEFTLHEFRNLDEQIIEATLGSSLFRGLRSLEEVPRYEIIAMTNGDQITFSVRELPDA